MTHKEAKKMGNGLTTIQIKSETRERLANVGRKSQTYDDLLNELLDKEGKRKK